MCLHHLLPMLKQFLHHHLLHPPTGNMMSSSALGARTPAIILQIIYTMRSIGKESTYLDGTALEYLDVWKNHFKFPISVNLSGCRNLRDVPFLLSLKSRLPSDRECMVHLEELDVSESSITRVHQSYFFLEKVQVLSFSGCKGLQLPRWFSNLTSLTSLNLRRCAVTEDVLDILYCLYFLKILNLGENNFVTMPIGICHLSSLLRLDLSGNKLESLPYEIGQLSSLLVLNLSGNNFVSIPHEIGMLSTLHVLDLSGNNSVSVPDEIGHLSSLQLLDLSGNNMLSLPKSISHLYELTVLRLFRCSKLQSLPNNLPFNLKHVYVQECPMLKCDADTLTIRASGERFCFMHFCFMHCVKSELDDQPSHVPVSKDPIELLFPIYIADRIYGKKPFEIRFPHSARIQNLWSHWRTGPFVTIPLSDGNSACMGFALYVVFEILGLVEGKINKSWELEETICEFHSDDGYKISVAFEKFIDFTTGSYALCCYEPRGGKCCGIFDKPSSQLRAAVSTSRPDLKLRGCAIHLISQEDAAEFIKCLANQTAQHLDSNFYQHCEYMLHEETTGHLKEQGSTSTSSEDSCSRRNLNTQLEEELLILNEGRNGREKSFYVGFPASVISFPPWFCNHHAGDVTICQLPGNLIDNQTFVGLELYVVFTRRASASSDDDNSFSFHVDFCAHDHESIVSNGSLKLSSVLGISDQLIVVHLPRVYFPHRLNQCQGISALFRSNNPEMEVQVCGSRLLFQRDLQDLIHSLAAAGGTLGEQLVLPQPGSRFYICVVEDPISEAQAVDGNKKTTTEKKDYAETVDQGNEVEGATEKLNASIDSSNPRTVRVLLEQAPTSSIMRLQKYRCYLQQNQGSVEFNILLHSRGRVLDNRDGNCQEYDAEEDTAVVLSSHHLCVMVETLYYGTYSSLQWKRCLELLLQYTKVATISHNGHILSALQHFNPSSTYNICFSGEKFPLLFRDHISFSSRVGMRLPPKLCDDDNWTGLVICAAVKVRGQLPLASMFKLLCHLTSKDYCLNPIPLCSITKEESSEPGLADGFIWLTYIPRVLLTEFNVISDVEARFYINCPTLTVDECGIRLLHRQKEKELWEVISGCCTSFFDNFELIRKLENVHNRNCKGDQFPVPEGHGFDPDCVYNATIPTSRNIPIWFEFGITRTWGLEIQLPAPSLCSGKSWIGLALCASYRHPYPDKKESYVEPYSYYLRCRLYPNNNFRVSLHENQMTDAEFERLSVAKCHDPHGEFIWLSYIPRRWFLHQLNGESVLSASFYGSSCRCVEAAHRFVYEHDVEEFRQLCNDLHQSEPENEASN